MLPIHHRAPGPLIAIIESKHVTAQIISDGHHLHPRIVNFLYTTLGPQRCVLITDGVQAIGLSDGRYKHYDRDCISKDGVVKYEDGTLIGTSLSLDKLSLKFQQFTGCSRETALHTISINPAKVLGIETQKGSIDIGKDADIVLLDDDNSIYATIIGGRIAYHRG